MHITTQSNFISHKKKKNNEGILVVIYNTIILILKSQNIHVLDFTIDNCLPIIFLHALRSFSKITNY